MVSRILRAYVRAARMRSWVRLSLAAATIFIAFVIFCVFLTESIFRLTDWRLGIQGHPNGKTHGTIWLEGRSRQGTTTLRSDGSLLYRRALNDHEEMSTCSPMNC